MTDKREQLIALCQLLNLSKTIKDDPAELIDAVLVENARINAENVRLRQVNAEIQEVLSLALDSFLIGCAECMHNGKGRCYDDDFCQQGNLMNRMKELVESDKSE